MCIVSGDIDDISNTKIFCGKVSPDTQITVYSNQIKTTQKALPSAMILPVPKKVTKVVDMSKNPNFFDELNKACQPLTRGRGTLGISTNSYSLPVERCGSYRYTIVPNISSFKELRNDIFDIDLKCIDYMTRFYSNEFEFIVCILDQNAEYSPFAYTHPCIDTLFVPTRHYHTHTHTHSHNLPGVDWDHSIYTIGCESTNDNPSRYKLERPGMDPWYPRSIVDRMMIKKWDDLGNTSHDNLSITVSTKEPIISNFLIQNWKDLKKLHITSSSFTNGDLLISVA